MSFFFVLCTCAWIAVGFHHVKHVEMRVIVLQGCINAARDEKFGQ